MSQAGANNNGSSSSGPLNQLTPDTGAAVTPVAGNINVFGKTVNTNNSNGIQTANGGAGELDVRLTNRVTGTATVVGAVTGDIITFDLGASAAVYRFSILVAGRDTAGASSGLGIGYTVDGSARTDGATAAIISTPDIDSDEDSALSAALISFIASGNNVILRATGVAGETLSYRAVGTYVVV